MNAKKMGLLVVLFGISFVTACTEESKIIENSDSVSVSYTYNCKGEIVGNGNASFVIGDDSEYSWMGSIILGSKKDAIFSGSVSGDKLFPGEYDADLLQLYPELIISEVLGLSDPQIGDKVSVASIGDGVVTGVFENEEGYFEYLIDFNDPKTYSDIDYVIQVTNVEKGGNNLN